MPNRSKVLSCFIFGEHARPPRVSRRLEEKDQLRQRQDELLAQRRKENAAKKTAILQSRIARSTRIMNIRQLHSERLAVKKADAKKASGDAARRCPCCASVSLARGHPGSIVSAPNPRSLRSAVDILVLTIQSRPTSGRELAA